MSLPRLLSPVLVLLFVSISLIFAQSSNIFQLNRQKLRELWYTATLRGLIKAKSREVLTKVPTIEAILYKQCELDAKSIVDLAKCATKLFNVRNKERKKQEEMKKKFPYYSTIQKWQKTKSTIKKKPAKSELWVRIVENENKTINMDTILAEFQQENDVWKRRIIPPHETQRTEESMRKIAENYEKKLDERRRRNIDRPKRKVEPLMHLSKTSLDYSKLASDYFTLLLGKEMKPSSHLNNLEKIKGYFEKTNKIQEYYSLINNENSRIYSNMNLPIYSRDPQIEKKEDDVLDNFLNIINNFAIVSSSKQYQKLMLDLLMDLSGAGDALKAAMSKMSDEINEIDNVHYPLMMKMSRNDHNWIKARQLMSSKQRNFYDKHGYTYLEKDQIDMIYGNGEFTVGGPINASRLASMNFEEREREIEDKIRSIAVQGERFLHRRIKRNDHEKDNHETIPEGGEHGGGEGNHNETEHDEHFETFQALAFTNFIGEGSVLEAITLSPHAFITEFLSTEFMVLRTLQPEAFIASFLSPAAMTARILSPTAFRAEVLAPRFFYPWVLSPEALITEVLTPRFFEPRVLSPEVLLIKVLSPSFISPNVGSGEVLGVLVLSPNILSPRISSEENFLVEIMSPHILGGPHGKHDSSVISIGGGEHEHDHEHGDEGSSAHQGDVHLHRGELEGDHAHDSSNAVVSAEHTINQHIG